MKNSSKIIGLICICLIIIFMVWLSGLKNYLTVSSLKEHKLALENSVSMHYARSVLVYLLIYIVIITVALPGVPILTMLGGFLFGFIPGGIYAVIGAVTGATLSFLIIRYLLSNFIRGKYAQKLEKFNERIYDYGVAYYLLLLQFIGLIPYFLINTLAALAHVPFVTFLWTTFVGSLPILFIYSFAGRQLYLVNSIHDIFSPSIIGLLVFIIVLALLPLFLRFSRRVTDL